VQKVNEPMNVRESPSDIRIDLVRLASHLSTLREINNLPPIEQKRLAEETVRSFVPLTERIKANSFTELLKEIAYQYTDLRPSEKIYSDVSQETLVALTIFDGQLRLASLSVDGQYELLDSFENLHHIMYVCSTETIQFQQAIDELESLVNDASTKEQALHEFFERNPDFILNTEYRRARSKIVLINENEKGLIPDFVLEPVNTDALCDLLELKLPTQKVFILKQSRTRFS
jgi:hypothetical protein